MNNIYRLFCNFLTIVGQNAIQVVQNIGRYIIFNYKILVALFQRPFYWHIFIKQLINMGYYSLPVVGMTAIFTGAVLALQSYTGFSRMHAEGAIASVVVMSITRELGPVLVGLMLAGRIGASIAAEIGSMKVSEQIDALYTLNVNPMQYLVVTRSLSGLIVTPLLVLVADIIGVMGGYVIAVYKLRFDSVLYLNKTFEFLHLEDVVSGLVKAAVFGFVVCVMGCYHGYHCRGGASGVGDAATNAIVSSSILILLLNYFITGLFFGH